MITVTKEVTWEAAHRLQSHDGLCRFIHGHSYKMQVTVAGVDEQLNSSGMVVDFHDLRTALYELEALFDHSLILQDIDPIGGLAKEGGPLFELEERVVLLPYPPTVENMARYCFEYLVKELGTKMNILRVRLYETQSSYADYYNPTIRVA